MFRRSGCLYKNPNHQGYRMPRPRPDDVTGEDIAKATKKQREIDASEKKVRALERKHTVDVAGAMSKVQSTKRQHKTKPKRLPRGTRKTAKELGFLPK